MSELIVYDRKSIIIYVDEEWKYNLLSIAKKLARKGIHVETMLSNTCSMFASAETQVDLESILKKFKMIKRWEEELTITTP